MISLHIYLPFVFTIVSLVTSTSCLLVESLVTTRNNLLLKGHVMQRQRSTDQLSCAHLCLRKEGCVSFNYKLSSNTKGLCELSSGTAGPFDHGLTEGAGWIYGQIVHSAGKKSVAKSDKSDIRIHVTFTSLGARGRKGPRDTSGYKGSPLEGKVQLDGGIQIWRVPATGLYSVTAWGASGGNGTNNNGRAGWTLGGKGARIKGHFTLTAGVKLKILVGQEGQISALNIFKVLPGGGGGGTFVIKRNSTPIVIAGGGGGGAGLESVNTSLNGDHGQTTENGTRHGGYNGLGGILCPLGSKIEGSGGGGYRGDGLSSGTCTGGQSFLNGGLGGKSWPCISNGGFGGGGAGTLHPGGGGGYSGGGIEAGEVKEHSGTVAGGGGSYNGGTMQENTEGERQGDGQVVIKLIK